MRQHGFPDERGLHGLSSSYRQFTDFGLEIAKANLAHRRAVRCRLRTQPYHKLWI
jgi:hypothetical protein